MGAQKTLTSFEVAAVVLELEQKLKGARVQNIYQIKGKTVLLKLHQPNEPRLYLLIEAGSRLHLTSYVFEKPQRPPAFCMALRKHLRNGIVTEINQHEFERVVEVEVDAKEGSFKLVSELFGDGNMILVDSQGLIRQALVFKKMRDRSILRRKQFRHAPSTGENPLHFGSLDLHILKKFNGLEVVRGLTKLLSISGVFAEDILLRAKVDKKMACDSLGNSDFTKISSVLGDVVTCLSTGRLSPCIIVDDVGTEIDAVPFQLVKYEKLTCRKYETFNKALDEYYAKNLSELGVIAVAEKEEREIARQQRMLKSQRLSLERGTIEAQHARRIGDSIYHNFHHLQTLHQRIKDEKSGGKTWREIVSKIEEEGKTGERPSSYFKSLNTEKLLLNLSIEDLDFPLNLRLSVQRNAATYYDRAKKAEKKVKGAEKAIEETLKRIVELRKRKRSVVEKAGKPAAKRRSRMWYEKFRWFHSSENLLVIGGKDAVTNEILIKKHLEPRDLVFHADMVGAPFVIIKAEGRMPRQQSIVEAAQLAASHSRAWRAKLSAIDVYWIHPEQVSKTPPTGQYLKKGAFMIRGKKNYVRKTKLQLAIGVDFKKTSYTVIGGPKEAVENKTDIYVEIVPGDLSSGKLARKIKQAMSQKASEAHKKTVASIPLEEIQAFIPFGRGSMLTDKTGVHKLRRTKKRHNPAKNKK